MEHSSGLKKAVGDRQKAELFKFPYLDGLGVGLKKTIGDRQKAAGFLNSPTWMG